MKNSPKKIWTCELEIIFLFLALTAPLNPFLTTKSSVYIWTFVMMGLGTINILFLVFRGYPPEEFSLEDETAMGERPIQRKEG